ncbi:alpha/beta hydrolase family protein [Kribbella sp. NPDC051586]|uniref:alpha/beta hydrolase family protein n=1 Tax=Kribbella sp. NPDC051586 TaxID=3364118 RepID=UPI003795DC09
MRRLLRRRWLRAVVIGLTSVAVLLVWYVVAMALMSSREVALPALSGKYQVGRQSFEWVDTGRTDPLDPNGGPRKLSVWLWYPAPAAAEGARLPYTPGLWSKLAFGPPVRWFETDFGKIRVHAIDGAAVADGHFPVVVLEPGMGFAAPQYSALAESLASRGYVVAGLTPTYSANVTVLGGQVVGSTEQGNPPELGGHDGEPQRTGDQLASEWGADARFVAGQVISLGRTGQFGGKIQPTVAYVGHSFGGASSLEVCRTDVRCAGAVDLDGTQFGQVVQSGLAKPFMIIGSEDSCVTGTCGPKATDPGGERDAAASLLKASTGPRWLVTVSGAHHLNFTDYSLYFLGPPLRSLIGLGSIDGRRALAIQNDYVAAFLSHAVEKAPTTAIDALRTKYPEATLVAPH